MHLSHGDLGDSEAQTDCPDHKPLLQCNTGCSLGSGASTWLDINACPIYEQRDSFPQEQDLGKRPLMPDAHRRDRTRRASMLLSILAATGGDEEPARWGL